jgi:hypothetical protein
MLSSTPYMGRLLKASPIASYGCMNNMNRLMNQESANTCHPTKSSKELFQPVIQTVRAGDQGVCVQTRLRCNWLEAIHPNLQTLVSIMRWRDTQFFWIRCPRLQTISCYWGVIKLRWLWPTDTLVHIQLT